MTSRGRQRGRKEEDTEDAMARGPREGRRALERELQDTQGKGRT